jgi:predicted TIM-barrel fold metal-dependent hydrolase
MAHAVNEWQLETWLRPEPRLRGSVVVPYEDAAASAAEIRKRAGDPNFCQVLMMSRTAEPAGNPRYWPIYEAAAEAGLPVAFHAFGYSGWAMTNTGWPSFYIEEVSEHATSCQNQVTSLVVEGVFERLPDLKVILIECGFAWLPSVAWRLDRHWRHLKAEVPHLRRAPSEVIREHVWVSTQPMEEPEVGRHLKDVMGWIGWDRILFATDYPHWDFDDPRAALPATLPEESAATSTAATRGGFTAFEPSGCAPPRGGDGGRDPAWRPQAGRGRRPARGGVQPRRRVLRPRGPLPAPGRQPRRRLRDRPSVLARTGAVQLLPPGEMVRCPWHYWEFDIRTGRSRFDPARVKTRSYEARVESGAALQEGRYRAETFAVRVERDYVVVDA